MARECTGCGITWGGYIHQKARLGWSMGTIVCQGVVDHPHLVTAAIVYRRGIGNIYDYPIRWITNPTSTTQFPQHISQIDLLRHAIAHGANIAHRDTRHTTSCIVNAHNLEVFECLIENGGDIFSVNERGDTILHCSVINGYFDFIRAIRYFPRMNELISVKNYDGEIAYDIMTHEDRISRPDIASFLKDGVIPGRNTKRAK